MSGAGVSLAARFAPILGPVVRQQARMLQQMLGSCSVLLAEILKTHRLHLD